eukprot:1916525-Pleurochrysis_carterae.AAC.2
MCNRQATCMRGQLGGVCRAEQRRREQTNRTSNQGKRKTPESARRNRAQARQNRAQARLLDRCLCARAFERAEQKRGTFWSKGEKAKRHAQADGEELRNQQRKNRVQELAQVETCWILTLLA